MHCEVYSTPSYLTKSLTFDKESLLASEQNIFCTLTPPAPVPFDGWRQLKFDAITAQDAR